MEVRVESAAGFGVPPGCYVGVRVGDVLKQGRYEPQRSYHFPAMERRRNAKIDIYRHVGSCVIPVDPEASGAAHEVPVPSSDPSVPEMRLKVNVQNSSLDAAKQRENRTKAVKNQAKDYLNKHSIEEKLSDAVKALLKEQPADPTDFLCRFLNGAGSLPSSPAGGAIQTQAPIPQKASPVKIGLGSGKLGPPAMKPFNGYYVATILPNVPLDGYSSIYSKFPNAAERFSPKVSDPASNKGINDLRLQARDVLVKASGDGNLSKALKEVRTSDSSTTNDFVGLPSVGTWLAKPQGLKMVPAFSKLPSVGTWLSPAPPTEEEQNG